MVRYDFGVEKRVYLNELTADEVDKAVGELVLEADSVNAAVPGQWLFKWFRLVYQ